MDFDFLPLDTALTFTTGTDKYNDKVADPVAVFESRNISENRIIWLTGEIDPCVTIDAVKVITEYLRQDAGLPIEERKPIRILIDSCGGDLSMTWMLCNIIESSDTPVIGVAMSNCMSGAAYILLSCHKRLMLKNANIMLHTGSINGGGNYEDFISMTDNYKTQVKDLKNFILERTSVPKNTLTSKLKSDWYITKEDAIKFGVVNKVIENMDEVFVL